MSLPQIARGGRYLRVADPDWDDPLDGTYSLDRGGRWNRPRSFAVVYLCRTVRVARANVARRFAGLPYGPEDLHASSAPILVGADVPRARYLDVITGAGCVGLGLPASYPRDEHGTPVGHAQCRRVGRRAWAAGLRGIACRSAAPGATRKDEELAWFQRESRLEASARLSFDVWFWPP